MPKGSDYETDFYAWTQALASAIRAKDRAAVDLKHVAEEIESLGRSDRRAITRQLERLQRHLLQSFCRRSARCERVYRLSVQPQSGVPWLYQLCLVLI